MRKPVILRLVGRLSSGQLSRVFCASGLPDREPHNVGSRLGL